jgi:hypothetical protein
MERGALYITASPDGFTAREDGDVFRPEPVGAGNDDPGARNFSGAPKASSRNPGTQEQVPETGCGRTGSSPSMHSLTGETREPREPGSPFGRSISRVGMDLAFGCAHGARNFLRERPGEGIHPLRVRWPGVRYERVQRHSRVRIGRENQDDEFL